MDTKRCVYCRKLSPADAHACVRCGRPFAQNTGQVRMPSTSRRPSIPPASPHHAGHHPGLHPEDQPYQSSMISILRPPKQPVEPAGNVKLYLGQPVQHEPERIRLAAATTEHAPQPHYLNLPITPPPAVAIPPLAPRPPQKHATSGRNVPIILTIACLVLLVVSSILAYVFINKKPELPAPTLTSTPGQLRAGDTFILAGSNFGARDLVSFTRDVSIVIPDSDRKPLKVRADDVGTFSVHITVQASWGLGQHFIHATDEAQQLSVSTGIIIQQPPPTPPRLQLSVSSVNLGAGLPGTNSTRDIILTNAGGGQLTWQASTDQPWLTVTPTSGTFSGKAVVQVVADRGTLAPQTYSGEVLITQLGNNDAPLKVTVTMTVEAIPASLSVSPGALTYVGSTVQNPADQAITLHNNGGQPVDWAVSATTVDGANWLSLVPSSGHLEPNAQTNVSVKVSAIGLKTGSYQGMLTFSYGTRTTQVSIALTVSAPPVATIGIQSSTLNFTTTKGANPGPQPFMITDTGNATLNWSLTEDANGMTYAHATPTHGSLAPGQSATITVTPNVAQANSGTIHAKITIVDSDPGTKVQSQQVTVNITINAPVQVPAAISLSTDNMTFANSSKLNTTTGLLTITNTGSGVLDWSLSYSSSWLSTNISSGTLVPGASLVIDVTCNSSRLLPDTYITTILVSGSESGTTVTSQLVTVTLTVSP